MAIMGYIFDFNTARAYEQWIQNPKIQRTAALENRLMLQMLNPSRGKTLLEIGCGSGIGLLPFIEKGVLVTGLDPSPYMLDIARSILGQRVDLHRGVGEDLPFEDNSFHYVCLNSTLEFVNDPHSVLAEACRVAKHKVYVGILNRYALRGYRRRIKNVFEENMADPLRYFSVGDIKRTLHQLLGNVPMYARHTCHFPVSWVAMMRWMEQSPPVQLCPLGAYAGIVALLVPKFKTTPISLEYHSKTAASTVPG